MPQVNVDPHKHGYVYNFVRQLTALFADPAEGQAAARALAAAGHPAENIAVFVGPEGADKLDLRGQHHGLTVRFFRGLEMIFADEAKLFAEYDKALRQGMCVLIVQTSGDEAEVRRIGEAFAPFNPQEVYYWGDWSVEKPEAVGADPQPAGNLPSQLAD